MIKSVLADQPGQILRLGRRRWTYDDLRSMPETMDRYEIIDGVLYVSPSAHVLRHQRTVGNLLLAFGNWVKEHDLGEVFVAPADVVVSPTRVVQPDLFFIARDRLHIVGAYVDGAPDLTVEVISPSSVDYDRTTKFSLYEAIGVHEYWVVDPEGQSVEVFVLREGRFEQRGRFTSAEHARSALLDGFSVDVASLFN